MHARHLCSIVTVTHKNLNALPVYSRIMTSFNSFKISLKIFLFREFLL